MSDDELKIPDRNTCQKLTEDFAKITETNEALAQTFLQDHEWDLNKSVTAFYDALSEETRRETNQGRSPMLLNESGSNYQSMDLYNPDTVEKLFGKGKAVTTQPPPHLKFLSWNLDGLDTKNLKRRTKAVIDIVKKLEPDVVFFQEVVPITFNYLKSKLIEYKCIRGGDENYFVMTLIRVFTVCYDGHSIVDFPYTGMGRNLLCTEAHMGKLKLQLINTHLESTAEFSDLRCKQLAFAFEKSSSFSKDYSVIFGGDLNLRDHEAQVPANFFDTWEYCGSPKEFKFTWDLSKNTNLSMSGKPRCRFDRIYFRFSQPVRAQPKEFALTGFKKATNTQSFPSDHWGVVVIFDLNHSV